MNVEILRRAAALMRERAGRANRAAGTSGRWSSSWDHQVTASDGEQLANCLGSGLIARHIASWPPVVALAVADWLDEAADHLEAHRDMDALPESATCPTAREGLECSVLGQALTVARVYLGEQS